MKMKILLVEDDEDVMDALRSTLILHGHEVHTAPDGMRGLYKWDHEGPYDRVLSDFQMPRMNGLDMVKAILSDSPGTICAIASGDYSNESKMPAGVAFLRKGKMDYKAIAEALKLD